MAAGLEQAAALDRKQRGAADRQLGAELLGREPGVRGGHGSRGCRVGAAGEATQTIPPFLLLTPILECLIDGDPGQVSEQALPIDQAQQRQAQVAVPADSALEEAYGSGGERGNAGGPWGLGWMPEGYGVSSCPQATILSTSNPS